MEPDDRPRVPAPRWLPTAALAGASVLAGWSLARALELRVGLRAVLGAGGLALVLVALAASLAVGLFATARAFEDGRRGVRRGLAGLLGALLLVATCGWQLFLALAQPFQRLWFDLALGMAAGAWAGALVVLGRWRGPSSRAARTAARGLVATCVGLLALEIGLRAVAALRPSPLFVRSGDAPRRLLERFHLRPGQVHLGFPCNAQGYYDEPFARRREGEHLVAAVGDSFNVGSVPHARHFTTVCEQALGVPVANLGVPGVGPQEYVRMLLDDALPLDPDVVVIGLFVGNDLTYSDPERGLPDQALRDWLERERVLLWVLPRRLLRLAQEPDAARAPGASAAGTGASAFGWLDDPHLEPPTLSETAYFDLETDRALGVCTGEPVAMPSVHDALRAAARAAGDRLRVMLVPDAFQVEDDLWQRILERTGRELERDRPQRLLRAWLAEEGIPCLDLLPALRAVEPMADGRRHVYHLRDTHFNARGNRVAGEALAAFLAPEL